MCWECARIKAKCAIKDVYHFRSLILCNMWRVQRIFCLYTRHFGHWTIKICFGHYIFRSHNSIRWPILIVFYPSACDMYYSLTFSHFLLLRCYWSIYFLFSRVFSLYRVWVTMVLNFMEGQHNPRLISMLEWTSCNRNISFSLEYMGIF